MRLDTLGVIIVGVLLALMLWVSVATYVDPTPFP